MTPISVTPISVTPIPAGDFRATTEFAAAFTLRTLFSDSYFSPNMKSFFTSARAGFLRASTGFSAAVLLAALGAPLPAAAADDGGQKPWYSGKTWYGEVGSSRLSGDSKHVGDTAVVSTGVLVPFDLPFKNYWPSGFSSYADFFVSDWRVSASAGGRRNYVHLGVIGTLRWRPDAGASPWFAEAGVGATVLNHVYKTDDRAFSTAFQFTPLLGVGRSFGSHGQHELSLRFQHVSNGSIKQPNPGINFLRLRYGYRFD